MHALMLGQVFALFEALVATGALVGLFSGVDAPVPLHLRGVLETLLAVRTLQRLLPGRVASVLHEL